MTPKEKAEELIKKFENIEFPDGYRGLTRYEAINCAIITVDELIEESHQMFEDQRYNYWLEVKQELSNKTNGAAND